MLLKYKLGFQFRLKAIDTLLQGDKYTLEIMKEEAIERHKKTSGYKNDGMRWTSWNLPRYLQQIEQL